MQNFSEKRDFMRMSMHCSIRYQAADAPEPVELLDGQLLDLSHTGMRLLCEQPQPTGTRLQVQVQAGTSPNPPLEAELAVLRCEQLDDGFAIAGTIEQFICFTEESQD